MKKKDHTQSRAAALVVRFFGYMIALGLSLLFALYMSAPTGWMFFYVLSAALIFSLIVQLLAFISYKKGLIRAEISFGSTNDSRIPVSNIKIKLSETDGAVFDSTEFSAAVSAKGSTSFDAVIRPTMWGALNIGEVKITVSDFMHIISFGIKPLPNSEKAYVFPPLKIYRW